MTQIAEKLFCLFCEKIVALLSHLWQTVCMDNNIIIEASVSECIGNVWHVCVNRYIHGRSFNPQQVMQTFNDKASAIAFAESHKPTTPIRITEGGRPFYLDEHKWRFAND